MKSIITVILIAFLNPLLSQGVISGRVTDQDAKPIENSHVFIRGDLSGGVSTDKDGYFKLISKDNSLIPDNILVVTHVSYKDYELRLTDLEKNHKLKIRLTSNDNQIEEVVFYNDERSRVYKLMDKVIENFPANYPSEDIAYTLEGSHSAISGTDTIIYLASPFKLRLKDYSTLNLYSDVKIETNNKTKFIKAKTYYLITQHTPLFMLNLLDWINFKETAIIRKRRRYNYKLKESKDHFVIYFYPKKDRRSLYSGKLIISKENYALEELRAKLAYNPRNNYIAYSIASKRPGSKANVESGEINLRFSKAETGKYHITQLNSKYVIHHIFKRGKEEYLYNVNTSFTFDQTTDFKKGYDFMRYMYMRTIKNKNIEENPLFIFGKK